MPFHLLGRIGLGLSSHFKLRRVGTTPVGSSISSKNREAGETAVLMNTPLRPKFRSTATRRREGSWRESKKDYLHFLYIARGSLSETQYFVHLARRLGYLSAEAGEALRGQTKLTFACLHGLIQAVEKEVGKLSKVVVTVTRLLVIGLTRWSSGQWSVVS